MSEILCQRCRIHPAAYQCPQGKSYCSVSCQVSNFLFIKGLEGATKVAKTQGQEFSPCNTFGREITIPISQIVCGQFRIGANWSAVLGGIECTTIGSRVATSLIRVAATRIFAEPEQSILEPIVNSLDAYHPQNKTGKFGMGFFSLIYWVIQKNATINIESNYMEEGDVLCGFSAHIWNQGNEVVMITLKDREVDPETAVPKLLVSLQIPKVTDKEVRAFGEQLRKLKYVQLSPILLNGKPINAEANPNTSKVVEVLFNPWMGFQVQDRATGISRDTFLRYLIVPTVSTKTIQMSVGPVAFTAKPRIIIESQPGKSGGRLLVLVNSIVVISLDLAFHAKFVFTIIIDLPPNTRIPVSRDDVFLESVKFEFEQNMEQLWRLCVGQETVVPLEQMMEFWSSKTSSTDNKLTISNTMQKMRKKFVGSILYVGQQVSPQYDELRAISPEVKIVSSQNWDPEMVEQWARAKWPVDDSYYVDRSIVFYQSSSALDMPKPFTGGLNSILFVSHLWKDIPLFAEKLAATFYETTLHLRAAVAASESLENFKEIDATKLSLNTKNLLKAICTYEETCIRVGWVGGVGNVDSWIDACINDVLIDATLQLLVTRLFPLLVASPRPSDYGAGEDNFRGFEWDTRESGFGIPTVQETPFAIVLETDDDDDDDDGELEVVDYIFTAREIIDNVDLFDKTILFCTELAKILVFRIINYYQYVKEIRLEDLIVNSLFPLLQTLRSFDSWPRKLLLVLIDICKNVQEFYCCYAALAVIGQQKNFQFFRNRKFDDAEYRFMAETLHGLVIKAYNKKPVLDFGYGIQFKVELMSFSNRIPEVVAQSFLELIRISMGDSMADLVRSDLTIRSKPPSAYIEFTLNDFIAESFRRNWNIHSPKEFFDELREIPRERQLTTQMVEIVINEGTTKDPILAQLTELTQNSLDAIRQFKPANSNIEIDIYFSNESDRHLLISVIDFVGMDPGALVSLSIPFYSNKSISDIVAGEMGTGFFNVYRSKRVRTLTDFNGHRIVFFDEPVYYESESGRRVKDVKRFASSRPAPDIPNGTNISITLEYPDQKAAFLAMNEAKQFVASVLGLVRLPAGAHCFLNNRSVTKQLRLMEETESFQFYVKEDAEPTTFPSYLMTKGVPFMPLTEYLLMNHPSFDTDLVKFIESNYVMNLKPGAYTPVQSRTKIGLAEKTKHDFEMCVKRQIYAALLSLPIREISQHFVGLISMNQVEITQVISTTSEPKREATRVREFAMDFAFSGLPSFRGLLAQIYAKWSSQGRMQTTEVRKIFISDEINQNNPFFALMGEKLVETNPTVGRKLWELAMKWFQNKYYVTTGWHLYEADKRKKYAETVKTKSRLETHQHGLLLGFVQVFVNNYVQIGQRLKLINSDREIPQVEITDIGNSSYSHSQNLLHYRVTDTERREQLRMLDTLFSGDTEQLFLTQISVIETSSLWQRTFSPNGTIAHELEHFRRGVSSEGGAHDTIVIDLPFGGLKARDFRLCHGDVMRSLVDHGFWTQVYQDYKKLL